MRFVPERLTHFYRIDTLEDVLEELLGAEIVDEHDEIVDLQAHARASNPIREGDPDAPRS